MDYGVPQGSVLGPLLWYNRVLRALLPDGATLVYYADDTLVVTVGKWLGRTIRRAEIAVAAVVARFRDLGLRIDPCKTEAVCLNGRPRSRLLTRSWIRAGGACVEVGPSMKYLRIHLDSHWSFEKHLDRLVPRVERTAASLGHLLPNLGGPGDRVAPPLYGRGAVDGPIWISHLGRYRDEDVRAIREYHTTFTLAALTLAGGIPSEIQAAVRAYVYHRSRTVGRVRGVPPEPETVEASELQAWRCVHRRWRGEFSLHAYKRVVRALLPHLDGGLPPLRRGGGLGAAHTGGVPRLFSAAPSPNGRHWG
ncbi:uncharacterized protein LOC143174804 [Nomia melanderi]|uniref:uncharacterized protein LOC143174804 n=1 Tax=Nomia melanderi TaxID=2448451 RepID=UPI003FCE18F5